MGISLGLVGLGEFGSAFADMFKSHPLVDRVALCDREPERIDAFAKKESFQDKFDPKDAYGSFDEIVGADLDALVIITQPWLHAPQAVAAMEAGKDVYSAVPVIWIPDSDEILDWCDRIVETSRTTGKHYMLGETTYYRPEAMYCRRKAAEGAFGGFVFAEGEYFHDVDLPSCNLRDVRKHRTASTSGKEWLEKILEYRRRGVKDGPMHYPTHSISGPVSVMGAHMTKVSAWGTPPPEGDDYFVDAAFANETALFQMSNGAAARICEYRNIGVMGREMFNILGTEGTFYGGGDGWGESRWITKVDATSLTVDQMRAPLPEDVYNAFRACSKTSDAYGGHGGSHAYLVHEFVEAVAQHRQPAINAWEAVRYMAAGATAHKSALAGGELLNVPDWGDAPA